MFAFSTGVVVLISMAFVIQTDGHAFMSDPPGRASAWRYGFPTPQNFGDGMVGCGRVPFSSCGVCGDPLTQNPGDNQLGGKYGSGIIVKTYKEGSVITVKTRVTANHKGWFDWSVCRIEGGRPATEGCFKTLISLDASRRPAGFPHPETKWELRGSDGTKEVSAEVQLPAGFSCDHCVLRWRWNGGNDWGCDAGGCGMGHGDSQEKFYACADVAITASGSNVGPTMPPTTSTTTTTAATATTKATGTGSTTTAAPSTTTTTTTTVPLPPQMEVCDGAVHGEIRPDPNNCCAFMYCMWPGTQFQAIITKKCPTSLAYNVETKQCTWAGAVQCGDRSALCTLRK